MLWRVSPEKDISQEKRTSIIYESPHQLIKLLEDLSTLCGKKRPIQIARELTKRYEETIGSTIEETINYFSDKKPKGEFTLVLGWNNKNDQGHKISESEALNQLNKLIIKGEKSKIAARIVSEETGYDKKWLYSKLNKKLDK